MSKEDKDLFSEIDDDSTTMYGEFVTSYFAWLPIDKQREKAKEMGKMTNNNK